MCLHLRCLNEDVRALYARLVEERGHQRSVQRVARDCAKHKYAQVLQACKSNIEILLLTSSGVEASWLLPRTVGSKEDCS